MAPQAGSSPTSGASTGNTASNNNAQSNSNGNAQNTDARSTQNAAATASPTATATSNAAANSGANTAANTAANSPANSATSAAANAAANSATSSGAAPSANSTTATTTAGLPSESSASNSSETSSVSIILATSPSVVVGPTYEAAVPTAPARSNSLSPGAIGGIVGGVIGALAFAIFAFVLWRMCRGRGEKLPPPPPRPPMQSVPREAFSARHSRHSSMGVNRASSYSTLITPNRTGSMYGPHQYYSSYPVASNASSLGPEHSPKFGTNSTPSGSPSLSSSGTRANTPAVGNTLVAPQDSSLRDGASTSDSASGTGEERELRPQGSHSQLSAAGDLGRPVTPSERSALQGFGSGSGSGSGSDSRATSPRGSTVHLPSTRSLSNLSQGRHALPRSSSGGAPHTRPSMVITLPRPLSGHSVNQYAEPVSSMRSSMVYTPRGSLYATQPTSARSNIHHARSYGEFGSFSNARSQTHTHQRHPSGSFPPLDGPEPLAAEVFAESPIDTGESLADPSNRMGHGIV